MNVAKTFREDRRQAALRLVGSAVMLAVSLWLLTSQRLEPLPSNSGQTVTLTGWAGVIFFGVLMARYAWAVAKPGQLTVSEAGIEQDLGWRRKQWLWSDIRDVALVGSVVRACMIYPNKGLPVRLFGWEVEVEELKRDIDLHRSNVVRD